MDALFSWTSLIVVVVVLALILITLKVLGKINLTFRFRGAVTVSPFEERSCPHLGLIEEPFVHRDEPSDEHRCYLWMQKDRIDLTHQKGFCLTAAHSHCSWLSVASPEETAPLGSRVRTGVAQAASYGWDTSSRMGARLLLWLIVKLEATVPIAKETLSRAATAVKAARTARPESGAAATPEPVVGPVPDALPSARQVRARGTVVDAATASLAGPSAQGAFAASAPKRRTRSRAAVGSEKFLVESGLEAIEKGDDDTAYGFFVSATEMNPGNEKTWFWRAKTAPTLEEVVYSLERALEVNPGNEKVKANLAWAIQRQQREEEEAKEAEVRAVAHEAKASTQEAKRINPVPIALRWIAGLACLGLAVYWVLAAAEPLFEMPALKGIWAGIQASVEVDLRPTYPYYDAVASWLPSLTWVSLPWYDRFQLTSGYSLLAAVPYTVGFLYLFIAIGVLRRESWSLFWGLAITVLSLALGMVFSANPQAISLLISLGLAIVVLLLVSRSEFRREARQDHYY